MTTVVPAQAVLRRPGRLSFTADVWRRRLLIGIVMAYVGLLVIAPIVALITGAFAGGLGAVVTALSQPDVRSAFGLTLWIALITVVVHTICGTAVAWMMVRQRFPGRQLLNGLLDLPFAVSAVVVGYLLLLLFGRQSALAPWLAAWNIKVAFALPGMILATLFVTMPFMVRELMPILEEFGVEPEQAAATLGANGWQTFWLVTFPTLRWGFIYGLTLTFARALGEFGAVLVIGGGVQRRTETATLYILRALEERQSIGASSSAPVLGLLSLILVAGGDVLRRREK